MEKIKSDYTEVIKTLEKKIHSLKKDLQEMENLFASRPSKDEDIKLIYELQEELLAKDKLLKKAEDDMEFYKMTLINSEENYNKVFGTNPKVGSLNPLAAKKSNGEINKKGQKGPMKDINSGLIFSKK